MSNPIHKVLSTMQACRVRCLLMGGQACILYGGAEFSRDVDFAVMASTGNLERLRRALAELQASVIAVPPFDERHLARGHAVHFRCGHEEAFNLRVDIMSVLRGLDPFEVLWERRTSVELEPGLTADLLSLPDLVKAKKTQRDKDWPMIRRLVEADYARSQGLAGERQVRFWLQECRTPAILLELAASHGKQMALLEKDRPLLALAWGGNEHELERALVVEELAERQTDRQYWEPLRRELEGLRHAN
jgi:hypothetical protein